MDFTCSQATQEDINEIFHLVIRVFNKFVAPNYIPEGNEEFYKYLDKTDISKRLTQNHFILLCKHDEKIVGLIEIRNFNHISLLFVLETYQGKGIAKELLKKAIEICKSHNPKLKEISTNASPNSVEIYQKLGFTIMKDEQVISGIRFTPMALTF
ncbi:MAG: GNAT family N-acetyltransferase [Patescibacteria group bacterium]|nr:GNAT family N-acetyltransferase [Patescibacteria group bacterium]MDE2589763.1 GNAT family N-acetyltransferase [Patescibacteria group bacterium]